MPTKGTAQRRKPQPIESFYSPDSTSIAGADYNPGTRTLTIHFQTGHSYDYSGFPPEMWRDFWQSASKGSYHAKCIRPAWTGVKK